MYLAQDKKKKWYAVSSKWLSQVKMIMHTFSFFERNFYKREGTENCIQYLTNTKVEKKIHTNYYEKM